MYVLMSLFEYFIFSSIQTYDTVLSPFRNIAQLIRMLECSLL